MPTISKNIYTDVDVEIDLDDFDTETLIEELIIRYNKAQIVIGSNGFSISQRNRVKKEFAELYGLFYPHSELPLKTLEDQFKHDHLMKVWDKYRSSDFEKLLPE